MGSTLAVLAELEAKLPKGVYVNRCNGREALTIGFKLASGQRRKESLAEWRKVGAVDAEGRFATQKDENLTRLNFAAATKKYEQVTDAIAAAQLPGGKPFVYGEHFPKSKLGRANRAPHQVFMRELFDYYEQNLPALEPETIRKRIGPLKCWLRPQWDNVRCSDLMGDAGVLRVIKWLENMRDGKIQPKTEAKNRPDDLRIRPGTAKQILVSFYAAIGSTMGQEIFGMRHPFKHVIELSTIWGNFNGSREDYVVEPFTREEQEKIRAVATPMERCAIDFLMGTGVRPAEFCGLRWDKVILTKHLVQIHFQSKKGQVIPRLKNKQSRRDVPLTATPLRALQELHDAPVRHLHGHVFTKPNGDPYLDPSEFYEPFMALLDRAGVTRREPKQCRHTFASRALKAGNKDVEVAKVMGHKGTATLKKYYEKWMDSPDTINGFTLHEAA